MTPPLPFHSSPWNGRFYTEAHIESCLTNRCNGAILVCVVADERDSLEAFRLRDWVGMDGGESERSEYRYGEMRGGVSLHI
mgnify:CR=1 FL=1